MEWVLGIVGGGIALFALVALVVVLKSVKDQKAKQAVEYQKIQEQFDKNKDIDLSTLPFCVAFKKEYKKDFFEFKAQPNVKLLCSSEKEGYYHVCFWEEVFLAIKYNSSIDKIMNISRTLGKTDENIELLNLVSIEEFKEGFFAESKLLYVGYEEDVKTIDVGTKSSPSKLNLAVTEAIWGQAAATQKILDANTPETHTFDYSKFMFVFDDSTKLPILYANKISAKDFVAKFNAKRTADNVKQQAAISTKQTAVSQRTASDEIRELKTLLDEGLITREEFDSKKKLILGL